jgi:hypothetical protein
VAGAKNEIAKNVKNEIVNDEKSVGMFVENYVEIANDVIVKPVASSFPSSFPLSLFFSYLSSLLFFFSFSSLFSSCH